MAILVNWHTAPLVVTDKHGKRHTIKHGDSVEIEGDFSTHPMVKRGLLSLDGNLLASGLDKDTERTQLRARYKALYGTAAPGKISNDVLRQRIEAWQNQDED